MRPFQTLLTVSILALTAAPILAADALPLDMLLIWPLDTAVVSVDSSVSTEALSVGRSARHSRSTPSPASRIARNFYPRFGTAIAHAARKVDVVDSSAADLGLLSLFEEVRLRLPSGDSAAFALPVAADADSARYGLVLGRITFSATTKTVARRFVEPTPPDFDPATGEMTPGRHKGYSEGPGKMTTMKARAIWVLWDRDAGVPVASGKASAAASFRGNARTPDWDEVAQELAKDVLRQTPFTPF
jgi:hypothetical protein